jgi:hypothetical protein
MKKNGIVLVMVAIAMLPATTNLAIADDATVLPKGVFSLRLDSQFYFPIEKRFNNTGDTEDIAEDLNTRLDSSVFPQLSLVEAGFGLPSGFATFGDTDVEYEYKVQIFDFYLYYGLTNRLTLGGKFPYWNFKNDVDAELDNTNATVGLNPGVPGGVAPLAFPGTRPATTEDIQQLLKSEYGFKAVDDWDRNGFSDLELGYRYQYFTSDNWRLAFTNTVIVPTGETDDPDSLVDFAFGTGTWGLALYANNDYLGLKKYGLELNATFRYLYFFPDTVYTRVPESVDQPIAPLENKERLDRKLGEVYRLDLEGRYEFIEGFNFSLFYRHLRKRRDQISGDRGLAYNSLQKETNEKEHQYRVGLTYSTIPLFQKKEFPVPMSVKLYYRKRFAAENLLKSEYIGLDAVIYF